MNLGLRGKQALVLGASRGLGAAVARALALEGATVVAAARSVDAIVSWRETLPPEVSCNVHPVAFDLSDRAQIDRLAANAAQIGETSILVNNSGGPPPGGALTTSPEQWVSQFQTMAAHLFHLTALMLPPMLDRGWGRVITIASSGVEQPIPNLVLSNGIRSSIVGWSKTLSLEVGTRGVTVNVVLPGRIHTDRVDQLDQAAAASQGKTSAEVAKASASLIPVGRYGRPEEFADVVAFLASERASYITGTKIRVDGGMTRAI